jgi:hypothetical protein
MWENKLKKSDYLVCPKQYLENKILGFVTPMGI